MTYDQKLNIVIIYIESFKNGVVKLAKDVSKLKRVVEKFCLEDIVKIADLLTKEMENHLLKEKDKKIMEKILSFLI